ncbi:MAG: tRNA uridine-5-carboxymethylaminomethyl(34) synthesis enzyme MnmG, partial [Cyclobacteriaceae bacterium]
ELIHELEKLKLDPLTVNDQLTELKSAVIRERVPVVNFLKRPEIGMKELKKVHTSINDYVSAFPDEVQEQAEIQVKYITYIDREEKLAQKIEGLEHYKIKQDFDYDRVKALSSEAREKLKKIKPETLGQASRISGVSPADISVLTIYMGK